MAAVVRVCACGPVRSLTAAGTPPAARDRAEARVGYVRSLNLVGSKGLRVGGRVRQDYRAPGWRNSKGGSAWLLPV